MNNMQFETPEKEMAALAAALCVKVNAYVRTGNLLDLQLVCNSATRLFHNIRKHYGWEEFGKMLDAVGVQLPNVAFGIDTSVVVRECINRMKDIESKENDIEKASPLPKSCKDVEEKAQGEECKMKEGEMDYLLNGPSLGGFHD